MITVQFKLTLTPEQELLLHSSTMEYIRCVNMLSAKMMESSEPLKLSTADFQAELPSAVKNEVIRAAKSVVVRHKKGICETLSVLKKPVVTWNNQNFKLVDGVLSFPLWVDGKSQRIAVRGITTEYQQERLDTKLQSLRITQKNGKWMAQIAVVHPAFENVGDGIMGIDLGLKIPAVSVTDNDVVKFFGNGRMNKYMKRKFRSQRKSLGKSKKKKAISKLGNKEQRWMKDQDHKISRAIVNHAKENNVSTIRMEQLQNIRKTARTSRKNEMNLHSWSFYRLAGFIEYKADMLGIKVEYVNPAYTSQKCPQCGERNKTDTRSYLCHTCGHNTHRDIVGASNIISAPVSSGKRKAA